MRLDYPKDLAKNLNFRVDIRNRCINDPVLRHEMKELCRRDILTWVNLFCWTKDPRKSTPVLPFITYDYQDKYILEVEDAIDKQYDRLSEKSRDAGASWCILYVLNHKWQFEIGSDFRVGSRKEEFVDKLNVIDTLLEKVRFNLARQPGWLLPKGFTIKDHAGFMRIVNPENGNTIVGESANPHFASGGRSKAVLMDEFSKWDVTIAKSAWSATADVTGCRLPLSTPLGSGNKFAMLAHGTEEKIVKSTLHWTLHPNKTKGLYYKSGIESIPITTKEKAFELWKIGYEVRSEWYDAECERRSESDVAQELDINYLMSGYPFFSMKALALQKIFPLHVRSNEIEPIPFERHILINLIETDGKIEPRDKDGWLRVYEYPEIGKQYIVAADTSEGLAKGDEATIVVREKFTNDIIAVANGAYPPDDIAYKIQKVAKWYNVALTAPENNNHGFCFDKETEILTDEGWKHFEDLNKKEKVATLNIKKDLIEMQRPTHYTKTFEEYMYKAKRHHADFCVSKEHSMLTRIRYANKNGERRLIFKPLSSILHTKYDSLILKHCANWKGRERKNIKIGQYVIPMNDWLDFLGIFLADGNTRNYVKGGKRQYYFMSIAQSESYPENIKKIRAILNKMPFYFWEYKQKSVINGKKYNDLVIFKITNKSLWAYLIKNTGVGVNKKAPDYIANLTSKQIQIFLDSFFMGDGFERRGNEKQYCAGLAHRLADQLQEYIMKVGKISKITTDERGKVNYIVHEHKTKNGTNSNCTHLKGTNIRKVEYNDLGYCVSVPNETVLVRRHGRAVFLGNTTCNILRNLDCNLYHTMTQGGDVKKPGFTTTAQTRPLMLDLLEQQIRKNEFAMRDEILIKQCRTFVKNQKSGKPEADGDFKDDVVMACAISGWMVKEHPFQAKADDNSGARRRKIEEFKKPVVRFR